jgi:hypothetical protein
LSSAPRGPSAWVALQRKKATSSLLVALASRHRFHQLQQRSRHVNPHRIRVTACKRPALPFRPERSACSSRTLHSLVAPKCTTSTLLVNPLIEPAIQILEQIPPA